VSEAAATDLGALLDDHHGLAEAADAIRERAFGDVVTYRRAEEEDAELSVFECEPGEPLAARVERLREAAGMAIVALAVEWPDGTGRASGQEVVRTLAAARLLLPEEIHLVARWRALGPKLAQVSLGYGVDDLGAIGTDREEERLRQWAVEAGRTPRRRDGAFRLLDEEAP
jgi:2-iminoacetate synthase ThiH